MCFDCIGGVLNCGAEIPNNYILTEGRRNSIELTLCGNPQPKLSYTFKGRTEEVDIIEKVDDSKKKYKYKINLKNVDRNDFGSKIVFKATGFKDWQTNSTIQVKCKQNNPLKRVILVRFHTYLQTYANSS